MSQIRTWKHIVLLGIAILLGSFSAPLAFAQSLPCGNIVGPEVIFNFGGDYDDIQTVKITDCNDPFDVTTDPPSPYTLEIDGIAVGTGETFIQHDPIQQISVEGRGEFNYREKFLFKHQGDDYVFVDESVPEPTQEEYRDFAATYFDTSPEAEQYLTILFEEQKTSDIDRYIFDEEYKYLIDAITGESIYDRYYNFQSAANNYLYGRVSVYATGTYTMVIKESLLTVSYNSFWQNFREFFIKTAHAQSGLGPRFYIITFTIADPTPESVGASSVLFLPGIQASRLYMDGVFGSEDQLWEPSILGGDVKQLELESNGLSVNEIYTRDVIDSVAGVGSIYGDFLDFLENEKDSEKIKDFHAFAYDWRFDVYDIVVSGSMYENTVKSVIEELQNLADDSYTGQVSIIAHSNGGLLTKALMTELESEELSDLVDRVVFIGVPQLGTPKALASLLHGYDQGDDLGGVVMTAQEVREVMNNMSGAYGLLPSERYFEEVGETLFSFGYGTATTPYIENYGLNIADFDAYKNFLVGDDDLDRDIESNISIPTRVNPTLLANAFDKHKNYYDSWVAPENVEVFEIIGYGLPTVSAIEYRTLTEKKCLSAGIVPLVCIDEDILKPFVISSNQGDGTVLAVSAEAYQGDKEAYYLDLFKINDQNIQNEKSIIGHANLTELATLQSLVGDILQGTSAGEYSYVSKTMPDSTGSYDIHSIDSPVALWAVDREGRKTGATWDSGVKKITEDIPGSQYYEIGDTKYIYIPSDTEYTIELEGEDYGGYTLTVAELGETGQQVLYQINNASTTPDMAAQYTKEDTGYSPIDLDINGDGYFEAMISIETGEVIQDAVTAVEVVKKKQGTATRVKRNKLSLPTPQPLTSSVVNDSNQVLLQSLIDLLIQYRDILIKLQTSKSL